MHRIYLDFNVVLDIANGLNVQLGADQIFVYSDEHFVETARGNDLRPIDVLNQIGAHKLEIEHDHLFQMTGNGRFIGGVDPHQLYQAWQAAIAETPYADPFSVILSRLLGAQNHDALQKVPADVEQQLWSLLEKNGLLDEKQIESISEMRRDLEAFVADDLKNVPPLQEQREMFGLHGGRAGNLATADNPLEALWQIVQPTAPGITSDQFYGFAPLEGASTAGNATFLGDCRLLQRAELARPASR